MAYFSSLFLSISPSNKLARFFTCSHPMTLWNGHRFRSERRFRRPESDRIPLSGPDRTNRYGSIEHYFQPKHTSTLNFQIVPPHRCLRAENLCGMQKQMLSSGFIYNETLKEAQVSQKNVGVPFNAHEALNSPRLHGAWREGEEAASSMRFV